MYIDVAYLNAQLGASDVASLAPDSSRLNQSIATAESIVDGALKAGGYSRRSALSAVATTPELVKTAVFAQWMLLSNANQTINVREVYAFALDLVNDIRDGLLEIDGEQKSTARGPGGVAMSRPEDYRQPLFSRKRMVGF